MRFRAALGLLLLTGCRQPQEPILGKPTIDTLPGGIVRVHNDEPAGWRDSSTGWRVEQELRISGEDGSESEIANPQSIALDDAGRIWVSDRSPARLKLYGSDGRFIKVVAREGQGPGEFRVGFIQMVGTNLVLHDPEQSRTSVFDSSGVYLRSFPSHCCYHMRIGADHERVVIRGTSEDVLRRGHAWFLHTLDGRIVDTLFSPRSTPDRAWRVGNPDRMEMFVEIPFTPRLEAVSHSGGGLLLGNSGTYQLARIDSKGDSTLVFGRSWTPDPVTERDKEAAIDEMVSTTGEFDQATLRKAFRAADIPPTRPAFSAIWVDRAGNTWAQRDSIRFDVFDPSGVWLGELSLLPAPIPETAYFGRERIAASHEEADGRPVLIVWRIRRPGG